MAENLSSSSIGERSNNFDKNLSVEAARDPLSAHFLSNGNGPGIGLVTPQLDDNNFHY